MRYFSKYFFRMVTGGVFCGMLLFGSCKGVTTNPTGPAFDDDTPDAVSSPKPAITETPDPDKTATPTTSDAVSCDNYADHATDATMRTLTLDGTPLRVVMECAGDVDWFKIELKKTPQKVTIALTDLSQESDFDLTAYDSTLQELENGRSSRSGNSDEELTLELEEAVTYVQVYAFSKRGEALLTVTIEDAAASPTGTPTPETDDAEWSLTPTPEDEDDESDVNQLTYEQLLRTHYSDFPRGTTSGLLEQSVETAQTATISCRKAGATVLSGELTIGNFAHVKRGLLESVDYLDGWAFVVFNGSKQLLDHINLTMSLTISSSNLDMQVHLPTGMEQIGKERFMIDKEAQNVYYVAQSYGNLEADSSKDLRISSGIVGESDDAATTSDGSLFKQTVDVSWEFVTSDGLTCSGDEEGKAIADFELGNFLAQFRQ